MNYLQFSHNGKKSEIGANLEHILNFVGVHRISMYLEFHGHLQTTIYRDVPHFQKT